MSKLAAEYVAASQITAICTVYCGSESNRAAINYGGKSQLAAEYVVVRQISPRPVILNSDKSNTVPFEWLPLQIKKQSNKNTPMNELYYPTAIRSFVKNYPKFQFCFDLPLYYTAASQTLNSNISSNSKPNSKISQGKKQCFRWVCLMKKTRVQKSRATVPLSNENQIMIR
jgi:hypothetical protein